MSGLDLAKHVGLKLCKCKTFSERINCTATELEQILREKISDGILVAWQVQKIVWDKFDGENFLPNVEDLLEIRLFNRREEVHLKRAGKFFVGRYVRDDDGTGTFYADSFSRFWGECTASANGRIKLCDERRKISMELPCDDGGKKFYGLTTRNYIDSDDATGLSGYFDYRFVAIESAWDGD